MSLSPDITQENLVRLLGNRGRGNLQASSFSHARPLLVLQHARPRGKIRREFLQGLLTKRPGFVRDLREHSKQ
jgi:hypothetical protein